MDKAEKDVDALKDILREIEFIHYEDPDEGLQIFCPVCAGRPKPETLSRGTRAMYPSMESGRGHDKSCKLARALYGPPE